VFEEAELSVMVHAEYDTDRLIEIDIMQPDDYRGESAGSSLCDRCVYVSAKDARVSVAGLEKAIAKAEAEEKRRAVIKARRANRMHRSRTAKCAASM